MATNKSLRIFNITKVAAKTSQRAECSMGNTRSLNYIFECDWLIEMSDNKVFNNKLSNNKLSDNSLASELVENRTKLQAREL